MPPTRPRTGCVRCWPPERPGFFRFDTADVPQRLGLRAELGTTSWHGELVTAEDRVDLDEVGAVYVRRPRAFEPPAHLSAIEQWHSAIECRYALGGILASLGGVAGAICLLTPLMLPTNPSSCVTSGPAAWSRHQR
jgi:MvdD pre-ATP grasp domain